MYLIGVTEGYSTLVSIDARYKMGPSFKVYGFSVDIFFFESHSSVKT